MSSAPRGLAPHEGLGSLLMKMGLAGPPFEPRCRPQAGKSGDPRSQNADSIVGQTDVGDVKVDELGAVVVALPEGDWKANLPYGNSGTISDS